MFPIITLLLQGKICALAETVESMALHNQNEGWSEKVSVKLSSALFSVIT
jgi:hypothetical protein